MSRILMTLSFICWLNLLSARPSKEPTKFNLSTEKGNVKNIIPTSRLEQGEELLGRIVDAIRIGRGRFVNSVVLARNIIADQAEQLINEIAVDPAFVRTYETTKSDKPNHSRRSLTSVQSTTPVLSSSLARLENKTNQGILERPNPDNIRQVLNSFLTPKPLLDRIREEEKYGNAGERFSGIGRTIVNAFETFSNFLNQIVDLPGNAIKQTSHGITDALNHLGARLVGLE